MTTGVLGPGAVVGGRYEIEAELGRGGSAVVYGARDRRVGEPVALKVLAPPPALAHLVRERTRREILAVRALSHPGVVPIFDLLEEGPYLVLAMEWVRGSDLEAIVAEKGALPADEVAAIGQAVAEALSAAHHRGILHRDVKPRNVLVDGEGRARLTDFGSARVQGQETLTHTGGMVGTLDYAAPEVLAGKRADARADIYALGMTLYLAAAGRLPPRASPHLPPAPAEDGHHLRDVRPGVPAWLDGVVARATAADPRRRFPTAAGLARALGARALAPLPAPRPVSGRVEFCLSCGAPEPLGSMICARCGELGPGRGDAWLLAAPGPPAERRAAAARLAALAGLSPDDPGVHAAIAGRRVLVRLHAALAARAAEHFAARGVPVRVVSGRADLRLVPPPLYFATAAAAALGTLAGLAASPTFLLATPPLAAVVLLLGRHGVTRPLLVPEPGAERLPPSLVSEVSAVVATLADGEARALLADVVRLARGLFGGGRAGLLEEEGAALVRSACAAAGALGRVEDALVRLEPPAGRSPEAPSAEVARLEAARTALVQHLLDAVAALAEALAEAARPDPDAIARLARTSREIREELALRAAAQAEVEAALLAPARTRSPA